MYFKDKSSSLFDEQTISLGESKILSSHTKGSCPYVEGNAGKLFVGGFIVHQLPCIKEKIDRQCYAND